MPHALEICIEDLDRPEPATSEEDERYIRCVALSGDEPGLALDREGVVRWMPEGPADRLYGLWVSDDQRLVLLRGEHVGPVIVERGGRQVQAPPGKPVILMDQDLLRFDERRLRVHLHGETEEIFEPEPVRGAGRAARGAGPRSGAERSAQHEIARAAAAAVALGAMVGLGGTGSAGADTMGAPTPIEVRARPPRVAPPQRAVNCSITGMKPGAQGLVVSASCPDGVTLTVGMFGQIVDPQSGAVLEHGMVKVQSVKGKKVVCQATHLKQAVKATSVRFHVRRY